MALKVAKLHDGPHKEKNHDIIGIPVSFLGVKKEFNAIEKGEQNPIMCTIYKYSFEGHRLSTEDMDEGCLELSFDIMSDTHNSCKWLHPSVQAFVAKKIHGGNDDYGAQVLDVENILPFYLSSQILYLDLAFWVDS